MSNASCGDKRQWGELPRLALTILREAGGPLAMRTIAARARARGNCESAQQKRSEARPFHQALIFILLVLRCPVFVQKMVLMAPSHRERPQQRP